MLAALEMKEASGIRANLLSSEKECQRKALEQIIGILSSGNDMSCFFVDVARLFAQKSLKLRRLIYIFISRHGPLHPEKVMNVLHVILSDLYSQNYHIRVMSLKCVASLASIDFVADAFVEPLYDILYNDSNAQVRQTAILSAYSIFNSSSKKLEKDRLKECLLHITKVEKNPEILGALCSVLNGIRGIGISSEQIQENLFKKIIYMLIDASDGARLHFLRTISQFQFRGINEVTETMQQISPIFYSANTALVVTASNAFVALIYRHARDLDKDMFLESTKESLSFLLRALTFQFQSITEPENRLYTLQLINNVLNIFPFCIEHLEASEFYLQYGEPSLVQLEKLNVLRLLGTESNAEAMLLEFREYTKDFYVPDVSVRSVQIITEIGLRLPRFAIFAGHLLKDIIATTNSLAISDAVVECVQYLLRLGAQNELEISLAKAVLQFVQEYHAHTAILSLLWILGEYYTLHENAEIIVLRFLENFENVALEVQLALLTTILKIYVGKKEETDSDDKESASPHLLEEILSKCARVNDPLMLDRLQFYRDMLNRGKAFSRKILLHQKTQAPALVLESMRDLFSKRVKPDHASMVKGFDEFWAHSVMGTSVAIQGKLSKTVHEPFPAYHEKPISEIESMVRKEESSVSSQNIADSFDELFLSAREDNRQNNGASRQPSYDFGELFD
ncbi:AP-2 complex subunit beta-like protein [Perkinsela sp. CCAP 1560/4]|nr:AP-2 complex subunit beta-like protein [Perkinsela sp. CCAP 1560/4]|eukprot:KNH08194.1 AP-2 complex subunit beta-like protein [Perkinsela sp. CCAP 1560/4]